MLIPLTPCYLFINMAEGFLWLRWVTKGSAEPQLGFFMLQGETSILHPTEGFGWSCRNCSHLSPLSFTRDNLHRCSPGWRRRGKESGRWAQGEGEQEEEERRKDRKGEEGQAA